MDLSIIIVNYKSKGKLINCLRSLAASNFGNLEYEIIVVENNSGDHLEDIAAVCPKTRLIISPENLGMGGGNNLGIKNSFGSYLLIANPDLVFKSDAVKHLYDYISTHAEAAIVGPKLINPDGTLQYSCAHFPSFFLPLLRRTRVGRCLPAVVDRYLMKADSHEKIEAVDWILGACLLLRRGELFIGDKLFDERFFMYFEDVDLCRRAREAGKETVYFPLAEVTHDHMRDSARLPWYQAIFCDKLAKVHINSWWKYFIKWGLRPAPSLSKPYAKD